MPTLINQEMVLDNEDDDGCCIERKKTPRDKYEF